jgi:hypothetical protein
MKYRTGLLIAIALLIIIMLFVYIRHTLREPSIEQTIIAGIAENCPQWLAFHSDDEHKLELDKFELESEANLQIQTGEYQFDPEKAELYKYLRNPQKPLYLDLYSYKLEIGKNDEYWGGFNVDTEVALIDSTDEQRIRIYFAGPAIYVEDGFWLDSENLVFLCIHDIHKHRNFEPLIWHVNLEQETISTYAYDEDITLSTGYLEHKFAHIDFDRQ